jgi:hypothetical protein
MVVRRGWRHWRVVAEERRVRVRWDFRNNGVEFL